MFSNFLTIILSTHNIFVSNLINSQAQKSIYPLNLTFCLSQISSRKIKNRDYPSGLMPDCTSRKVLIYVCFYVLTSLPLTSILPSQREIIRLFHTFIKHNKTLVFIKVLNLDYLLYIQFSIRLFSIFTVSNYIFYFFLVLHFRL